MNDLCHHEPLLFMPYQLITDSLSFLVVKKQKRQFKPLQGIQIAGPAVQAIRVVTVTRNLRTQPFTIPGEINAVGKAPRISEASEMKDRCDNYLWRK